MPKKGENEKKTRKSSSPFCISKRKVIQYKPWTHPNRGENLLPSDWFIPDKHPNGVSKTSSSHVCKKKEERNHFVKIEYGWCSEWMTGGIQFLMRIRCIGSCGMVTDVLKEINTEIFHEFLLLLFFMWISCWKLLRSLNIIMIQWITNDLLIYCIYFLLSVPSHPTKHTQHLNHLLSNASIAITLFDYSSPPNIIWIRYSLLLSFIY